MMVVWNDIISSTSHGAATASRAPLTVQDCRDSISERVRASSRVSFALVEQPFEETALPQAAATNDEAAAANNGGEAER